MITKTVRLADGGFDITQWVVEKYVVIPGRSVTAFMLGYKNSSERTAENHHSQAPRKIEVPIGDYDGTLSWVETVLTLNATSFLHEGTVS